MKRSIIVIISIAVLVAALLFIKSIFFPANANESSAKGPGGLGGPGGGKPMSVEVLVLKNEKIDNNIQVSGTVLPNEKVDLSPEGSGKVIGIYFNEGQAVKSGQLLVKLNDEDLKAQLNKANVSLKLAQDIAARQEKLLSIEGTSKEDYDIAANQVLSYKADIEYIQTQIRKTEIRAPYNGIIGFRNIALGSYVSPSTVVATLQQINPIKVEFSAPERYMNRFKVGQAFTFVSETGNKLFQGKIQTTSPQINLDTRTVVIRGIAENKGDLMPGNFVKVNIDLANTHDGLVIPTSSVVPILKGQKVYLFKDGKAVEKEIQISNRTDKTVQVVSGIQPGDTLITTGIIMLKDGMAVAVANK